MKTSHLNIPPRHKHATMSLVIVLSEQRLQLPCAAQAAAMGISVTPTKPKCRHLWADPAPAASAEDSVLVSVRVVSGLLG